MQNVELKLELRDLPLARTMCLAMGAMPITTLEQTDTYYKLPAGRLKRRETPGEPTQYIFYHRADVLKARISTFTIYNESEAILLYAVHNLPEWVRVQKSRELLMLDHMRIHLDRVEGLGAFVEFEALISPSNPVRNAHETLARVRRELLPTLGEPISCGYSDLIAAELSGAAPI
jgi:adenylate cyclase class IV